MNFLTFISFFIIIQAVVVVAVIIATILIKSYHKKIADLNEKAIRLFTQGKTAEAIDNLTNAIKLNPVSASSHAILAEILSENQETLNSALEEITTAIKIAPLRGEFYKIRGSILMEKLNQVDAGRQDFARAEELCCSSETFLTI